jgi:hypothetical protein
MIPTQPYTAKELADCCSPARANGDTHPASVGFQQAPRRLARHRRAHASRAFHELFATAASPPEAPVEPPLRGRVRGRPAKPQICPQSGPQPIGAATARPGQSSATGHSGRAQPGDS